MRNDFRICLIIFMLLVFSKCSIKSDSIKNVAVRTLDVAAEQYGQMLNSIDTENEIKQPRTLDETGKVRLVGCSLLK